MNISFDGKTAIVTGAATGIGAATARQLAAAGAQVGLLGLQPDLLRRVAKEISDDGGAAVAVPADISDPAQVEEGVAAVVSRFGALHLACHAAGIPGMEAPLHETTVEDWRQTLSVNLDGIFYAMRYELPHLLAGNGGAIVNIASVNATAPLGQHAAYTTSKHGIVGLTKNVALDYARFGVRANVVSPGVTDTPMTAGGGDTSELMKSLVPMQRMAQPSEIANAVLFALSEQASYLTGSEIIVDGAFLLRTAAV